MLVYVFRNTRASKEQVTQFIDKLLELPKTEDMMTIYDQLIEEGKQLAKAEHLRELKSIRRMVRRKEMKMESKIAKEKAKAEQEKAKAEQEKIRAEQVQVQFLNSIQAMLKNGLSADLVAETLQLDIDFVNQIASKIK
ncbi:MAG: hypothetical protein HC892_01795 [Saprospiraceae bacterium]|nr:hypothetical protein [Saprospiraceae bacterium]